MQRLSDLRFMFYKLIIFLAFNAFAMFLPGLYAGRRGIFQDIPGHLPLFKKTLWWGLALGAGSNLIYEIANEVNTADRFHMGCSNCRFGAHSRRTSAFPELYRRTHAPVGNSTPVSRTSAASLASQSRLRGSLAAVTGATAYRPQLSPAIAQRHHALLRLRLRPLWAGRAGAGHTHYPCHFHRPNTVERLVDGKIPLRPGGMAVAHADVSAVLSPFRLSRALESKEGE